MGPGVLLWKCCSHSHHINFCSHSEQYTYSHSHGNTMGPVGIHWFPLSCTPLVQWVIIPRWSSLQCFEMVDRKGIQPVRENSALVIPKCSVPSVLWRCWLGGRKNIRLVKNWVVRYLRGYLSGARCNLFAYGPCHCHPIISCSSKIQNSLPFWCRLTQVVLEKRPLNRCSSSGTAWMSECQKKSSGLLWCKGR